MHLSYSCIPWEIKSNFSSILLYEHVDNRRDLDTLEHGNHCIENKLMYTKKKITNAFSSYCW